MFPSFVGPDIHAQHSPFDPHPRPEAARSAIRPPHPPDAQSCHGRRSRDIPGSRTTGDLDGKGGIGRLLGTLISGQPDETGMDVGEGRTHGVTPIPMLGGGDHRRGHINPVFGAHINNLRHQAQGS